MSSLLNDEILNDEIGIEEPMTSTSDADKYAKNLNNGLVRLTYLFKIATSPAKYQIAFDLALKLVNNYPLKSNLVWKTVSDAYQNRFVNV